MQKQKASCNKVKFHNCMHVSGSSWLQLLHPFACTGWQVGGAKVVRWLGWLGVTTWLGGTAGEWCQFQWPQSRGSPPPPPTRGCCWTGTHTQTDASHLQSQSQSCLVVDDQWCQHLQHNNDFFPRPQHNKGFCFWVWGGDNLLHEAMITASKTTAL